MSIGRTGSCPHPHSPRRRPVDQDRYGTLAQVQMIEDRIYSPIDVEILAGCGHAPHLEQPERTLNTVTEFVRRLERIEHATVEIS